jgi:aminomethyltransferase
MSGELEILKTPLHAWHVAHGGRMVEFGGWSMPVQYTSIVEEHNACRNKAALFDVSHMGRLRIQDTRSEGNEAEAWLDSLLTRKVLGMTPTGKARYSLMCQESGGILDDVILFRSVESSAGQERPYFFLVVNASNRDKIVAWMNGRRPATVELIDQTLATCMIAIQGPQAVSLLQKLTDQPLNALKNYQATHAKVCGVPAFVSRTGYTGEDGCEIVAAASAAESIWNQLVAAGALPAGLGARDTLRLEAAMPLYGHELSETINPLQAGLNFAVNLEGRTFIGSAALQQASQNPQLPRRVGLKLAGRRVPREHYAVYHGDRQVGEVTSGTFSPTFNAPLAMAYVEPNVANVGQSLTVDIRGSREPAEVTTLPFYRRHM